MYSYRINVARMEVGFPRPTYRHFFDVQLGDNGRPAPTQREVLVIFRSLEESFPKYKGFSVTMSRRSLVMEDVTPEELTDA